MKHIKSNVKITLLLITMILMTMYSSSVGILACTAFCVKSSKVIYGKNWDFDSYRKKDAVFTLEELDNGTFSFNCILENTGFLCSAINSNGFFVTSNRDSGAENASEEYRDGLEISDVRERGVYFSQISDIKEYVSNKNIVCNGYPEHIFFADKNGDSCILETDNEKSYWIEAQNDFLVATNFPLHSVESLDLGISKCSRYREAYNLIHSNLEEFDLSTGIDVLKNAAQSSTIYSFLYDAEENEIYLFLNRNYRKIWKFSFDSKKIFTYEGFRNYKEFEVNQTGVNFTDLETYQEDDTYARLENANKDAGTSIKNDSKVANKYIYFLIPGFIFIVAVIIILIIRRMNKKRD